eukprot:g11048.t1
MIVLHALPIVLNAASPFLLSAVVAVESSSVNRENDLHLSHTTHGFEIPIPPSEITGDYVAPDSATGFAPQCMAMQPSKATLGGPPGNRRPRMFCNGGCGGCQSGICPEQSASMQPKDKLRLSSAYDGDFGTAMQTRSSYELRVAVDMNSEAQYVTLMEITDDHGKFFWNCNQQKNYQLSDTTTTWTLSTFTYAVPEGLSWNAVPNAADPAQPQPRLCEGPIRIPANSPKFDARPDLDAVNYEYDFGAGKGNLRTLTTYCNDANAATQLMDKLQIVRPGSPNKYIRWTEIEAWGYPQAAGIPPSFKTEWKVTLSSSPDPPIKIARIRFYLPNKVGWMQGMNLEFDGIVEGSFYPYDRTSQYGPNVNAFGGSQGALPGVEALWKWSGELFRTYEIAWEHPGGKQAREVGLKPDPNWTAAGKIALATICGVEIWKKSGSAGVAVCLCPRDPNQPTEYAGEPVFEAGSPATGSSCPLAGSSKCDSCARGFTKRFLGWFGSACLWKKCSCPGGTPTQGWECEKDAWPGCAKCDAGNYLVAGGCFEKTCVCPGGTPGRGETCPQHGAHHCTACDDTIKMVLSEPQPDL